MSNSSPVSYRQLLKTNPAFRRLWFGQTVTLLGDWFNTIALYRIIADLTGSPLALGAVFIFKTLPWALAAPLAGLLVDRLDRKRVMVVSDLLRVVIVLGLILVDKPSEIWLLYTLISLQVIVGSAFEPARSAVVPNITRPEELLTANTLGAATWSIMLALGAALGGVATEFLGTTTVFILDAATYVVSALLIAGIPIPHNLKSSDPTPHLNIFRKAFHQIVDGWRFLYQNGRIGRITTAKALWSLGGGGLVYTLTLLGEEVFPLLPSMGIGLFFAARGLGTGIGPVVARRFLHRESTWPVAMGLFITASGLAYVVASFSHEVLLLVILIIIAHATSGANWVFASVLLQKRTEDAFRGRVFSTEWLFIMVVDSLSILAASLLMERQILNLRETMILFAVLQIAAGLFWLAVIAPRERIPQD